MAFSSSLSVQATPQTTWYLKASRGDASRFRRRPRRLGISRHRGADTAASLNGTMQERLRAPMLSLTVRVHRRPKQVARAGAWNERIDVIRTGSCDADAGLLRRGKEKSLVRPGVFGLLRAGVVVWLHAGGLAIRPGRSRLVWYRAAPMVARTARCEMTAARQPELNAITPLRSGLAPRRVGSTAPPPPGWSRGPGIQMRRNRWGASPPSLARS